MFDKIKTADWISITAFKNKLLICPFKEDNWHQGTKLSEYSTNIFKNGFLVYY